MKDIGVNKIIPSKKEKDVLLIATDGDGVYKLNLKQLTLNHFLKEDTRKPNKMNGSIIKDIYMDSANRIWNVIYPTGITIYTENILLTNGSCTQPITLIQLDKQLYKRSYGRFGR